MDCNIINISGRHPIVTELKIKPNMHIIGFQITTNMLTGINRRRPMAAVLSITVNENILDSHTMILIEISLREIVVAMCMINVTEMGLRVSEGSQEILMVTILVTVRTFTPSTSLKTCIDGVL